MDLQVNRSDLHRTRVVHLEPVPLGPGEARLRVDAFGLSANNVTYAVAGDMLQYWSFFPAEDGWGRVPVWGFADVVESTHPDLPEGRRCFGYLPMSEELVVQVGRADERGFSDTSPHRRAMASAYSRYQLVDPAGAGTAEEDRRMLLYPLFFTAFLVDDFLDDHRRFGASVLVVSSASSKTALGIARFAAARPELTVVGLTSPGKVAFVEGLGVCDVVLPYGREAELPDGPAAYVDVSGSGAVRAAVHRRYGDDLVHDMVLGATHWEQLGAPTEPLEGPEPAFFFAPSQIAKRSDDWGQAELDRRMDEAWATYGPWAGGWIRFEQATGADAVAATFLELLDDRADPTVGHIASLTRSG
ncbi:MAG: DUF2855 family protein [Actinobacteria bacterium]|nr:DUF2855 family protein [Actinomycetota bacterium]